MNRKATKVNILGTEISIAYKTQDEDTKLYSCDGYADTSTNSIVVKDYEKSKDPMMVEKPELCINKVLRHECVHHFFNQSGLAHLCDNEEVVDWIAIQFPKLYKAFNELGCLD